MTRRNKLLLGFLIIVLVPVITVWVFAWPILRPWMLPEAVKAEMILPQNRTLNEAEIRHVNQFLAAHRTGWGTRGEQPPRQDTQLVGKLVLYPDSDSEKAGIQEHHLPYRVFYWHFRHGESVIGIEWGDNGPYRMRSLSQKDEKELRQIFVPPVLGNETELPGKK